MVIGQKFWPIDVGDYRPSSNPPVSFKGDLVMGSNEIQNVNPAVISTLNAFPVWPAVVGGGVTAINRIDIVGASGTTITFASNPPFPLTYEVIGANFVYYDASRPAAGQDKPIQAIVCVDGTNTAIDFYDASGTLVQIPDGVLVPGAVYYFEIGIVDSVTPGTFVGYAPH
jgi:hypothetical protein